MKRKNGPAHFAGPLQKLRILFPEYKTAILPLRLTARRALRSCRTGSCGFPLLRSRAQKKRSSSSFGRPHREIRAEEASLSIPKCAMLRRASSALTAKKRAARIDVDVRGRAARRAHRPTRGSRRGCAAMQTNSGSFSSTLASRRGEEKSVRSVAGVEQHHHAAAHARLVHRNHPVVVDVEALEIGGAA